LNKEYDVIEEEDENEKEKEDEKEKEKEEKVDFNSEEFYEKSSLSSSWISFLNSLLYSI